MRNFLRIPSGGQLVLSLLALVVWIAGLICFMRGIDQANHDLWPNFAQYNKEHPLFMSGIILISVAWYISKFSKDHSWYDVDEKRWHQIKYRFEWLNRDIDSLINPCLESDYKNNHIAKRARERIDELDRLIRNDPLDK